MAGCGTSTNGVKNTHRPSLGSEGALRGLGSHPAVEDLPPGRLGRGRRRNPHLHPPQGRGRCARPAACVPRMWPRGSSPAFALWQDLSRALRGPRPSSWRLSISTIHNIPLKLLLRDLPNPGGYCLGIKKGGQPCTRKASHDGFCLSHAASSKLHEPVNVNTATIRHNHAFPPLFKVGCPACESSSSNQFRDLKLMM